jgi:hypothetical protein
MRGTGCQGIESMKARHIYNSLDGCCKKGNEMMRKAFFFAISGLLLLVSSCKPAPVATPAPMPAATQAEITPTLLPTNTPKPTATATLEPVVYKVSNGYCKTDHALTGDPTRLQDCVVKEKKQMELTSGQSIKYASSFAHQFASFCAIHQMDGKLVTSFIDYRKFGEAICILP